MAELTVTGIGSVLNDVLEVPFTDEQLSTDLTELGLDSVSFIRLIVALEEKYDVDIPDEYLLIEEFNTASKIYNVINKLQHGDTYDALDIQ